MTRLKAQQQGYAVLATAVIILLAATLASFYSTRS